MSIEEKISEIIHDFSFFESWEEKYEHLIDLGKSLSPLKKEFKTDFNLVRGCQARVWLICKIKNGKLLLQGDSDAIITKGLVGLLMVIFNNCYVEEVAQSNNEFLKKIGLNKHLSMTRSNGINEMIKKIRSYCLNYLKNE
jgi:cysteine desulfuration protein SufE